MFGCVSDGEEVLAAVAHTADANQVALFTRVSTHGIARTYREAIPGRQEDGFRRGF